MKSRSRSRNKMFRDNQRRLLREVEVDLGVHHTTIWQISSLKLKMFSFLTQIGEQLSNTDKETCVAFDQLCTDKSEKSFIILQRSVFSDKCSFWLQGAVNDQNCRFGTSQRQKLVHKSLQSSPTLVGWCALSQTGVAGCYFFLDSTVTGDRLK